MKLNLVYTGGGFFIPESDEDYEKKASLRVGETYQTEMNKSRNPGFHRKYFAMIDVAWQFLTEDMRRFFVDKDKFRKQTEMAAGYSDIIFSPRMQEFVDIPKSIAWDKIEQADFEILYTKVRTVLDLLLTGHNLMTPQQFETFFLQF